MLIVSKFHDYYDSVIKSTGVDKSIVYQRETKDVSYDWPKNKNGFSDSKFLRVADPYDYKAKRPNFMCFAVGFCGKTHIGVQWTKDIQMPYPNKKHGYYTTYENQYLYDSDAILWVQKNDRDKIFNSWFHKDAIENWKSFQFPLETFRKHKSPALLLYRDADDNPLDLVINPELKIWKFQTVVDPYTAFQDIQMFISGVLGNSEKEMITVSDKDKIAGHGFDPKWSFRKPPKEKV